MRAILKTVLYVSMAASALAAPQSDGLYRGFRDPPREYTVRPFWFWNARLDGDEIERQIREMVAKGVYGAYVHSRNGLDTPYLSEDYFAAVKRALDVSRAVGFRFGFVDEYEWPSGEARDVWLKGSSSRVLQANPAFRMHSLGYIERISRGPGRVQITAPEPLEIAVAARLAPNDEIAEDTIIDLSRSVEGRRLEWDAPSGDWIVFAFYLFPSRGRDGGTVDLLNPAAVRKYIELVYEEYYRRFGEHFGRTIDSSYSDHEGDYGYRLAWTPGLFATFERMKGYDLRRFLPLLVRRGGKRTPKVRFDYLDVVSELYYSSFFKQVATWCEAHGIRITGHVWEESLHVETAYVGDLQRMMRGWSWPGVDSLLDRGRSPRDFKVAGSVAHFRGTRFSCENQGLQGNDSYLDLQKMRLGTNAIAAWGVNLFVPHAFNYSPDRIEYPPDWFYHQPYWKHFKTYADYARRISYMNAMGTHVAPVLLYQPTEAAWADSDPVFASDRWNYQRLVAPAPKWNNGLDNLNSVYSELMEQLTAHRWDFDVADAHFLASARLLPGRMAIGPESFRVLVLPPLSTIRRSSLARIRQFYESGGTVIAVGRLPADSAEEGAGDPEIARGVAAIFADGSRQVSNSRGGTALLVSGVDGVLRFLERRLPRDTDVLSGSADHLLVQHRVAAGAHYYWVANDTGNARKATILFAAEGAPEQWNAETGERRPLPFRSRQRGTEVDVELEAWDASYVVFPAVSDRTRRFTADTPPPLPPIDLAGPWRFTPHETTIRQPYAELGRGPDSQVWLSRETHTIRDWWLVGPFPNEDHRGFEEQYPPERRIELEAVYAGTDGRNVKWSPHTAGTYWVNLAAALGLPRENAGATAYALAYVYSPKARRVQVRTAAVANAKVWLNGRNLLDLHLHPHYYEMRDAFALGRTAELAAGWNQVLVKISKGAGTQWWGFMVRIAAEDGSAIGDLFFARQPNGKPSAQKEMVAYRLAVPPGAIRVKLPGMGPASVAAYDGGHAEVCGSEEWCFRPPPPQRGSTMTIETSDRLLDVAEFVVGPTDVAVGSWEGLGLEYYSGSATYERDVVIGPEYQGRRLVLDCGDVGSTAEVQVNGQPAGVRVWKPFAFDITHLVRPGENRIAIVVTNTMENARAVENHAAKLKRLKSGLFGPVRLIPYADKVRR